jgi:hypothetical protein
LFERYTEKARRAIFFARYEASVFASPCIDTDHLLLGLMREDAVLKSHLGFPVTEAFRKQVEAASPAREKVWTSVDLPLSSECRRALDYAADESAELQQKFIAPGHLVLGLLHIDGSRAATFLTQNRIHLGTYRDVVRATPADVPERAPAPPPKPPEPSEPRPPKADALASTIALINSLLDRDIAHLDPDQRLKRKPWTRKEAMGHLIDLATAHHQWFARALTEPKLTAAGYPPDEWVAAQQYADYGWRELISLWLLVNRLLIHVLIAIPEEKLNMSCRIGIEVPCTLLVLIQRYVGACEDLVGQLVSKLD